MCQKTSHLKIDHEDYDDDEDKGYRRSESIIYVLGMMVMMNIEDQPCIGKTSIKKKKRRENTNKNNRNNITSRNSIGQKTEYRNNSITSGNNNNKNNTRNKI